MNRSSEPLHKSPWGEGHPSLPVAQKTDRFVWTDEANEAFEALKRHLANPPVLAAPAHKEPMLLYIAANSKAVSVAVVVERKEEGKEYPVQRPVYFISEVLTLSETLPTLVKSGFRGVHGESKAEALLPGTPDHGRQFRSPRRHHIESRGHWTDC